MPITPTYPGVYIQEIPSEVRAIVGVSTSIGALIGYFKRGPMNKAVHIFSPGDFQREFGGLDSKSEASYAIQQFFLNGGTEAWMVRTAKANTANAAAIALKDSFDGARRLALFIEQSLYRGTRWVVFESNDEPLWAQIRLNVGAFMHRLFRQGAFQGTTPKEAYLVKCDRETATQADINLGIVNIVVGFAPLKPAEFVIIKIQQLAGQTQA